MIISEKPGARSKEDHDGAWLTGRAACELPMGFGQPGRRTGFTGHALRVVEVWWLHRRDHRSRHPSLCCCSCRYDRGGRRGGVAAAPGRRQPVPLRHCLQWAPGLSWMVDFGRPGVALVAALPAERRQRLPRPAEKGRLHPGV